MSYNGLNLVEKICFSDHHKYTRKELKNILEKSLDKKAIPITTSKDFVKIPEDLKKSFSMLDIHIKFDKKSFFKFLNSKINVNV